MQQENAKLADLLVTVINHIRRQQLTEARLAVDVFLGVAITDSAETPLSPGVVEVALRQPTNSERFIVINDLPEEERAIVFDPLRFEEWMVYLHEGQRRVVDEDFDRPAILTGVSGSGKTSVLVHRARRLARQHQNERILILTLNKSPARLIENLVGRLCSADEKAKIDVHSFHEYLTFLIGSLDLNAFLTMLGRCTGHDVAIATMLQRLPPQQLERLFQSLDERDLFGKFRDFLNNAHHAGSDDAVRLWLFLSANDINADPIHYLYEEMELVRSAFTALDQYSGYLDGYERPGR